MPNLNHITIMGNLTRDPEMRATAGGKFVTKFGLAVNKEWKGADGQKNKKTTFFNCTCWGPGGEVIAKYVHKGDPLYVSGEMECDEVEKDGQKRQYWQVNVRDFQFLSSKAKGDIKPQSPDPDFGQGPGEDDIPI